jgi:hypothetical protein
MDYLENIITKTRLVKPMIMSTYCGEEDNFKKCRELGFTVFQTDSDHLSTNEIEDGQWDWSSYDQILERVHSAGARWMFFPHFAFPPAWYKRNNEFERLRCLEHDETIEAFSIWDEKSVEFLNKGFKALAEHYGSGTDNIYGLFLGVHGDYGECMFPAACRINAEGQKQDWLDRFGNIHNHYGYWCGDNLAREDFRECMLKKYYGLENLNKNWLTSFKTENDITYPTNCEKKRFWLDFIRWYLDSMVKYSCEVVMAANKYFPDSFKLLPLGAEDEDPRLGQDYSRLVKMAKEQGIKVRSTHGGFRPFAANATSQLVHISTACKHYGVPFWSEPPSNIDPERLVSRIFESICCGAEGYWDWHSNPMKPENEEILKKYHHLLVQDKPIVEVAILFPQSYHYLHPEQSYPEAFLQLGQEIRDFVHFDIVDENLIADGALDSYRYLIHLQGNVFEKTTLDKIDSWVKNGGVFCALLEGSMETVEDNTDLEESFHFDFSKSCSNITQVGDGAICTLKGGTKSKKEYYQMLHNVMYVKNPGKSGKTVISIDTETDGVYSVILESGRALLYNSTDQTKQKTVNGRDYKLPPISIVEIPL